MNRQHSLKTAHSTGIRIVTYGLARPQPGESTTSHIRQDVFFCFGQVIPVDSKGGSVSLSG